MTLPSGAEGAAAPLHRFIGPRYWLIWVGVGLLRLVVLLPFPVLVLLGRGLGTLARWLLPDRRRVAAINLALCFPEASPAQRATWLREHFHSIGMMPFDLGLAGWSSDARIERLLRVQGLENLAAARATGRGIVLITGHLPASEIGGRYLHSIDDRVAALYRPLRNPLVNALVGRVRARATRLLIPKNSPRQLIRALRQGYLVYYAPDQSQSRPPNALLPFFGEPAMTNTALADLVRLGNAVVLPIFVLRRADGRGYDLELLPLLEGIPGESPEADTLRAVALLEAAVRKAPGQYYWIHRRFKRRPAPLPDPYAS